VDLLIAIINIYTIKSVMYLELPTAIFIPIRHQHNCSIVVVVLVVVVGDTTIVERSTRLSTTKFVVDNL